MHELSQLFRRRLRRSYRNRAACTACPDAAVWQELALGTRDVIRSCVTIHIREAQTRSGNSFGIDIFQTSLGLKLGQMTLNESKAADCVWKTKPEKIHQALQILGARAKTYEGDCHKWPSHQLDCLVASALAASDHGHI